MKHASDFIELSKWTLREDVRCKPITGLNMFIECTRWDYSHQSFKTPWHFFRSLLSEKYLATPHYITTPKYRSREKLLIDWLNENNINYISHIRERYWRNAQRKRIEDRVTVQMFIEILEYQDLIFAKLYFGQLNIVNEIPNE
jgi:hypothetical protein